MEESFPSVLGQPTEICLLIASFLTPKDLSQAQGVNKSWYWVFGRESVWKSHLSPFLSSLSRPAKVEYVFHTLKRQCWERSEVETKELQLRYSPKNCDCPPNGSWMITLLNQNKIGVMRELESDSPLEETIGGRGTTLDPHKSKIVMGCMASPDGSSAFTFGSHGYFVKWKGLERNQITATLIAGKDCSLNPHESDFICRGVISRDGTCGLTYGRRRNLGVYWRGMDTDSPIPIKIEVEQGKRSLSNVSSCQLSPEGSWALVVGRESGVGFIDIWRGLNSGNIHRTVVKNSPHQTDVEDCVISLDGSWAITSYHKGELIQWRDLESDTPTPTPISLPSLHPYPQLKLSLDGTWLVVFCSGKSFVVHHLDQPSPMVSSLKILSSVQKMYFTSSSTFAHTLTKLFRLVPPIEINTCE